MKQRFVRFLQYLERLPFVHGQTTYVTFERDHRPADNRRDAGVPDEPIPEDIHAAALNREMERRAHRTSDN